jgi:hypothetical protein
MACTRGEDNATACMPEDVRDMANGYKINQCDPVAILVHRTRVIGLARQALVELVAWRRSVYGSMLAVGQ